MFQNIHLLYRWDEKEYASMSKKLSKKLDQSLPPFGVVDVDGDHKITLEEIIVGFLKHSQGDSTNEKHQHNGK
jgi:hypothetical protein